MRFARGRTPRNNSHAFEIIRLRTWFGRRRYRDPGLSLLHPYLPCSRSRHSLSPRRKPRKIENICRFAVHFSSSALPRTGTLPIYGLYNRQPRARCRRHGGGRTVGLIRPQYPCIKHSYPICRMRGDASQEIDCADISETRMSSRWGKKEQKKTKKKKNERSQFSTVSLRRVSLRRHSESAPFVAVPGTESFNSL